MTPIYSLSWFAGFTISFFLYFCLMKWRKDYEI